MAPEELPTPPIDELGFREWILSFIEPGAASGSPPIAENFELLGRRYEDEGLLRKCAAIFEKQASSLRGEFENHPFWERLFKDLARRHGHYQSSTGYDLLTHEPPKRPQVRKKTWESVIDKTYRLNVIKNEKYPEPPMGGWITPNNWFSRITDIVRSTIVVKYLDGVQIVSDAVAQTADRCGFPKPRVDKEAHDDGYYAVHVEVIVPLQLREGWNLRTQLTPVEIQIATQVQDVIHALSHKFYAAQRRKNRDQSEKWQWDHRCDQFVPNYLGHILQYVEGMIMQIREREQASIGGS